MLQINQLVPMVEQWGKDRGILDNSTPAKQSSKTEEEVNELIRDLNTPIDFEKIVDDIGDSLVTLILYCKMKDIDFLDIYNMSKSSFVYSNISPRNIQKQIKNVTNTFLELEKSNERGSDLFKTINKIFYLLFESSRYINKTPEYCLEQAYNIISKRTGKMVNGIFVKDEK